MQLPGPVRAFVGLIAVTAEEARHLPDRAIELPMLAVSSALQLSLRAQQRYARLTARGDDVLSRRPAGDEPPDWATFDDPVSGDEAPKTDGARAASQLLEELLAASEDGAAPETEETAQETPPREAPTKKAPAKRSAGKRPAKKATAAKKSSDAKAGKTINAPRHTSPSRFDTVDDS
ncbi:MAG TPA: hypothetical protein VE442_21770 [Jatrophihabitans sp.]|jgi:hypothetical protein|nr:hypothetical protein [Jatrophihabitans sp.]